MEEPGDSKIAPELSNKLASCLLRASSEKEEPSEYNKRTPPIIIEEWINYTARGVKALKLIITLILLLLTTGASNGAVSGDMSEYVRKDVYDVQMQNLNANMERILQKLEVLDTKVNDMSDRITGLSARVEGLESRMTDNTQNLSSRIEDMKQYIYLVLVLLGIVIVLPSVQKFLEWRESRKPLITLEDVRRLIEENNAELLKSLRT